MLLTPKKKNKTAELKTLIQKVESDSARRFGAVLKHVRGIKLPEPKVVEITRPVELRTETIREVMTKEIDPEALSGVEADIRMLKSRGGGSMNRQVLVGGVNPLTKYTDINWKAGDGISIGTANDNTNKRVDLTITAEVTQAEIDLKQSIAHSVSTKTGTYTILLTDFAILCDATSAGFTVNLPTALSAAGYIFVIKKIDSTGNVIVVDADGSETIDGQNTQTLDAAQEAMTIQSNGTAWYIIGNY